MATTASQSGNATPSDLQTNYYLLAVPLAIPLIILSLYPSRVLHYLQRKRYQYEVTFSLYMMTPTEKFIFNSILFLFLAMVSIATALYLPASVSNTLRRAWYYLLGDVPDSYAHAFKEMVERGFAAASETLFSASASASSSAAAAGSAVSSGAKSAATAESVSRAAERVAEAVTGIAEP